MSPSFLGCGYEWEAVRLLPGIIGGKEMVPQRCILPVDHEGPHRSATNVTKEQDATPENG
jgi:hypothetical protein